MFFMSKASILYEAYIKAQRIELHGERITHTWNSPNKTVHSKEWKEKLADEMISTYPEYKEYGLELERRIIELEDEIRKLKLENLALMESKEK